MDNENNNKGKKFIEEQLREWTKKQNPKGDGGAANIKDSPIPQKKEIDMVAYDGAVDKIKKKMEVQAKNQQYEECIPLRNLLEVSKHIK